MFCHKKMTNDCSDGCVNCPQFDYPHNTYMYQNIMLQTRIFYYYCTVIKNENTIKIKLSLENSNRLLEEAGRK